MASISSPSLVVSCRCKSTREMKKCRWVKPQLVAAIEFLQHQRRGLFWRSPKFGVEYCPEAGWRNPIPARTRRGPTSRFGTRGTRAARKFGFHLGGIFPNRNSVWKYAPEIGLWRYSADARVRNRVCRIGTRRLLKPDSNTRNATRSCGRSARPTASSSTSSRSR